MKPTVTPHGASQRIPLNLRRWWRGVARFCRSWPSRGSSTRVSRVEDSCRPVSCAATGLTVCSYNSNMAGDVVVGGLCSVLCLLSTIRTTHITGAAVVASAAAPGHSTLWSHPLNPPHSGFLSRKHEVQTTQLASSGFLNNVVSSDATVFYNSCVI